MTEISTSLEIFNSGLRPNILKFQHIMTQLIEISTIHQDQSHSNFNSAFPLLFCSSLNQETLWLLSMLHGGVGLSLVRWKPSASPRSTFDGGKAATPQHGNHLRKGLAGKQFLGRKTFLKLIQSSPSCGNTRRENSQDSQ